MTAIPRSSLRRASLTALVTAAFCLLNAAPAVARAPVATTPPTATAAAPAVAAPSTLRSGVYGGPGPKSAAGVAAFDAATGQRSVEVLDFPPTSDWSQIEGQSWLLQPHASQSQRLEYSLPLVPDLPGTSLAACAQGDYDSHWQALGTNLVRYDLADTIVRPGWEFNGSWYRWSAQSSPESFVECFRHVVTTMRAVAGQRFSFDWNVNVGVLNGFRPELAWPGDAYVDYVGVDVYDTSWTNYKAESAPTLAQQKATWASVRGGDHGLQFWARFSRSHGKQLAVPEWGVTWRSDGRGGGDDNTYLRGMFAFMNNPANRVAYHHYFNTQSADVDHSLTASPLRFPASLRTYKTTMQRVSTSSS